MTTPVAIITGAGSGIGRATAAALADEGYSIALVGRTRASLEETAAALASETVVIPADVAAEGMPAQIVDEVRDRYGRLDALINNAGFARLRPIEETDMSLLQVTFAVNAFAPALLIASAVNLMRDPPSGDRSPCIVNVSTLGTHDPFSGFAAYAAAKCALESLTRSVAVETAGQIRAFNVAPGAVETPMLRSLFSEADIPLSATMKSSDVAAVIVDCVIGRRDDAAGRTIYLPAAP